jgi:uncharacterized membrane protein
MTKNWYMSKTLWINFIGFIAILIQVVTGTDSFNLEYQAMALTIINAILRLITKEPLTVKK